MSFIKINKCRTYLQLVNATENAQKMRFSVKDFFRKCDQIRSYLWIWSHLLKNSLMKNFIFCTVRQEQPHHQSKSCDFIYLKRDYLCANGHLQLFKTNIRGVFRTLSNIYDEALYKNS